MTHHEVMLRQLRRLGRVELIGNLNGKGLWVLIRFLPNGRTHSFPADTVTGAIRAAYFHSLEDLAVLDRAERMAA